MCCAPCDDVKEVEEVSVSKGSHWLLALASSLGPVGCTFRRTLVKKFSEVGILLIQFARKSDFNKESLLNADPKIGEMAQRGLAAAFDLGRETHLGRNSVNSQKFLVTVLPAEPSLRIRSTRSSIFLLSLHQSPDCLFAL